jgi:hypothetical protein
MGGLIAGSLFVNLISLMIFGIQPILSQFARVIVVNLKIPDINYIVMTHSGLSVIPTVQNLSGLLGRWAIDISSSLGFFP